MNRLRARWTWLLVAGLLLLSLLAAGALLHPAVNWRAKVLALKLSGEFPEISLAQLSRWLQPGSAVYLEGLVEKPSPNSAIKNIHAGDSQLISLGERQFKQFCAACHGGDGKGGSGPDLVSFVGRSTDWDFLSVVKWGRVNTAMAAQQVSDSQIWAVHAFLADKARAWSAAAAGAPRKWRVDVPYSKLVNADNHPDEWLMYSGNMAGHRHSRLEQINKVNVASLRVAWAAQVRPATKPLSATPIVAGGLMFVSEAPGGVIALDAASGEVVWRFTRPVDPSKLPLCCGAFNRGVAILGNKLFLGTLDAALVALDASTGAKLWEVRVADPKLGYSITTAPLALENAVLIGVAGGEFGIRGFVAAFSPDDGRRVWQFDAIPAPGEPGHGTWTGESWKTGGASTWSVGTYDKERDVVYWTTGNPWPPLDTRGREGDNLYSNSVVALDRKTGKLRWYFQFTPADANDWDATQQLILTDILWKGEKVPVLLMASRNAFYYALDRRDGKFLYAKAYVKQTWSTHVDEKGRHTRDPASMPTLEGSLVWPWMHGGTNWWPPSYDAKRHLEFVPTVDGATQYFKLDMKYKAGEMTMGGATQLAQNVPAVMAVKAIDPNTGTVKWSTRLDRGDMKQFSRITGLVSTDGGIVVAGFEDRLSILDSDSGNELWKFRPGAQVNAGAITYSIDGKQYIAVVAGFVVYAFALP